MRNQCNKTQWLIGLGVGICFIGISGFAEVPDFLKRWEISPKDAAAELPEKRGAELPFRFSKADFESRDYVLQKDQTRAKICELAGQINCEQNFTTFELSSDLYSVNRFVEQTAETNIFNLDKFKSGASAVVPWSGHYWPHYEGGIGVRYGDKKFPHSEDFLTNFKYYQKKYHKDVKKIKNLDELSPAEKYDLLVDDKEWGLTYYSWAQGRRTYQLTGEVETWTGICHGWAQAAIVVPEPQKSFTLQFPQTDRSVKFYPDDVKALVSQLWASGRMAAAFIGGRCNEKYPATDTQGRIISKDCFDTNPASWHLVLLNWMGRARKSFVFDAIYDYQVWNQPIASYELSYFNPNTRNVTSHLQNALINYRDFENDPYRKYRSPQTQSIVGVKLDLKYVVEREASVRDTSPQLPRIIEVTYFYDLEIDANDNVIGGEWYQNAHPDMMWRPRLDRPLATAEPQNSFWNGEFPVPGELILLVKKASSLNQPLSAVLDQLVERSR